MRKSLVLMTLSLCAVVVAGSWSVVSARAMTNDDGVSSSGLESNRESLKKQQEQLREAQKRANEERMEAEKSRLEAERQRADEERERMRDQKTTDAKKKVCENRVGAIKKIMERTATNGQQHYNTITKVYTNVKTFAEKKNVDLATLSTEVANIDAAALTAAESIEIAKTAGSDFSCDVSAPKSAAAAFLAAKKAQAAALKAYRDAVKQLLVGVKSAVEKTPETTESDNDTDDTSTTNGGTQ